MKTDIHPVYQNTADGKEADAILRSCVHCGFCTATCPTYQQLNDERDGPRGRIYLLKQLLETDTATEKTQTHIDRCLTCRACETTCPSGVQYGRLVDIGRGILENKRIRSPYQRLQRWVIRQILPYPMRFAAVLSIARWLRPLLPASLREKIPPVRESIQTPTTQHKRKMLILGGCAQPSATPNTNAAAARVLDRLGISLLDTAGVGCCGALDYHLGAHEAGKKMMKRNIDAWWPSVEAGAEAVVTTASGCGSMVNEYGHVLRNDSRYAEKAAKISALAKDISEVIAAEESAGLKLKTAAGVNAIQQNNSSANAEKQKRTKVAIHCPCSLQHGLKLPNQVDQILRRHGFELAATKNKHLCCGSSGTYSILQPKMSQKLLSEKLAALSIDHPGMIVTSNIGCQLHLESKAKVPVKHWIELLDESLEPISA